MPKCYIISNNQKNVVKDMFFKELNNDTIKLKKIESNSYPQQYYLIQYKENSEISWWVSYTGVVKLDKVF